MAVGFRSGHGAKVWSYPTSCGYEPEAPGSLPCWTIGLGWVRFPFFDPFASAQPIGGLMASLSCKTEIIAQGWIVRFRSHLPMSKRGTWLWMWSFLVLVWIFIGKPTMVRAGQFPFPPCFSLISFYFQTLWPSVWCLECSDRPFRIAWRRTLNDGTNNRRLSWHLGLATAPRFQLDHGMDRYEWKGLTLQPAPTNWLASSSGLVPCALVHWWRKKGKWKLSNEFSQGPLGTSFF